MNRKAIAYLILGILAMFLIGGVSYAISPYEQAKIVAEEQFPNLLKTVIEPNNQHFGYPNKEQVTKASLGTPIESFIIDFKAFNPTAGVREQMKQTSFYVFPIIADGAVTIDLTVGLQRDTWDVIDVGGCTSKTINEMSKKHGLASSQILRFAGDTFIIAKKGDKEVAYSPYRDLSTGLSKNTLVTIGELKETLIQRHKEVSERMKNYEPGEMGGGYADVPSLEFRQESIGKRLLRFIKHVL